MESKVANNTVTSYVQKDPTDCKVVNYSIQFIHCSRASQQDESKIQKFKQKTLNLHKAHAKLRFTIPSYRCSLKDLIRHLRVEEL